MPTRYKDVSILLVDDDQVDVRAVKRGLRKQKIANPLYIASDGQEALEMLRGSDNRPPIPEPFLILLDLNMPRMNGVAFLDEIRKDPRLKNSIVFVFTTSSRQEDIVASYDLDISGYIVKSDAGFEFVKLIQMLEQFVLTVQFPP